MTSTPVDPHRSIAPLVIPGTSGHQDCPRTSSPWVRLRPCLTCGPVGCRDSSPMRHARAHPFDVGHPVVRSVRPDENRRRRYPHQSYV
jgi:hypothetical protein